ncbi:MAG: hypothetical protein AAGI54_04115 [Planctomycetota bacterium]
MASERQNREVTLTARLNDLMTRGLAALRGALGLTEDRMAKTARSGTAMGRGFRAAGSAASGLFRILRGGLGLLLRLTAILTPIGAVLAGIFGGRALVGGFARTVQALDQIAKRAARLSIGVVYLERLRVAAERAGVDFNTTALGIQRATRRIAEFVNSGGGEAADEIERLGLNVTDANGAIRPMSELLPELADKLAAVEDPAERLRIAFKFFDSEGTALLQLLQNGSAELDGLLGIVDRLAPALLDPEVYRIAERISDAWSNVGLAVRGVQATLIRSFGNNLADFLDSVASGIARLSSQVRGFVGGLIALARQGALLSELQDFLLGGDLGGGFRTLGLVDYLRELSVDLARVIGAAIPVAIENAVPAIVQLVKFIVPLLINQLIVGLRQSGGVLGGFASGASLLETSDAFAFSGAEANLVKTFGRVRDRLVDIYRHAEGTVFQVTNVGLAAAQQADEMERVQRAAEETAASVTVIRDSFVDGLSVDGGESQGGFVNGFKQVVQSFNTLAALGAEVGRTTADALGNGVPNALADWIEGAKSAADAFRDLAQSVLRDLGTMIARFLIFRGVSGLFGFGPGGIPGLPIATSTASPATGGALGFASGGIVPGRVTSGGGDSVPAMLTPGEFVMNKLQVMAHGGLGALEAQRRALGSAVGAGARALGRFATGGPVEGGGTVQYGIAAIGDDQIDEMAGGRLGEALAEQALAGNPLGRAIEQIARGAR